MKKAVLRPRAEIDLIEITQWYAEQGGLALGERFFDSARAAVKRIESSPGLGSPRWADFVDMPGLRSWPVDRFPVRWCYLERPDYIDVLRLLGERQDIEAILSTEPPAAG